MAVTLYLDVYVVVNFVMDFLILCLVKGVLHMESSGRLRIAGAAAFGALCACLWVLVPMRPDRRAELVFWALAGGIMVRIAFGRKKPAELLQCLTVLWIVSAAAGGVFSALGTAGGQWTWGAAACTAAGIWLAGRACIGFLKDRLELQKHCYQVTLYYQGKSRTVEALFDTGNRLYEPYSHQPVHVLSADACKGFCESISQLIYIPFQSVGTEKGMLPGVRMDEMEVRQDGKLVQTFEKPWIAVSRKPLSSQNHYEMLLHGELL